MALKCITAQCECELFPAGNFASVAAAFAGAHCSNACGLERPFHPSQAKARASLSWSARAAASLHLRAGFLDHFAPARYFGTYMRTEFVGRSCHRIEAVGDKAFA